MTTKIKVLLADDHTVLREAAAELVDHQPDMKLVGQAGTGEETIEVAKTQRPDVIVLDVAMPHMDGADVARLITNQCPGTKILVLSAYLDAECVMSLLGAGAIGYLPKTVGLNELLDAIRATYRGESVLPPSVTSVIVQSLSGREKPEEKKDLTRREMEVLRLVAKGYTNEYIAQHLNVSTRTVEAHLTHVFNKLNVNSRTEAAILAQRKGWLPEEEG